MTTNFNNLTKEQLIEKVAKLEKDYSDLAKEKLDLDWLFGNMCRTLKDYIENPLLTKNRKFPLPYKVVDNSNEILEQLSTID